MFCGFVIFVRRSTDILHNLFSVPVYALLLVILINSPEVL